MQIPETAHGNGRATFPIVIDIAPLSESESRQKHLPIANSAKKLGPRLGNWASGFL